MTIFTLYMLMIAGSPSFYFSGDAMCSKAAEQAESQTGKYFKTFPEMYTINFDYYANRGADNFHVEKVICAAKYSIKNPGETIVIHSEKYFTDTEARRHETPLQILR